MKLREFFEQIKELVWKGKTKIVSKLGEKRLRDKRTMLEEIISEFEKARSKRDVSSRNSLTTVRLSEDAFEYLEGFIRRDREEIKVKEILNFLSHKPYRPATRKV